MAVVGAGPAGCAAAINLRDASIDTLVLDRRGPPAWKLGETLPPTAKDALVGLGVWDRFLDQGHVPSPGAVSTWGGSEPAERDFIFEPYGPGWHLDRVRFDGMLQARAAEAGADVRLGSRLTAAVRADGGGWLLDVAGDGGPMRMTAEFVVDATGRAAWFSRGQGAARHVDDRLVGVAALLALSGDETTHDTRTVVEAVEHGWWYSAVTPGPMAVVAYMTDADLLPAAARRPEGWWALMAATTLTRRRLEPARSLVGGPKVVPAASVRTEPAAGGGWVAVGDAAAAYDPLSAQGIATALESGPRAGFAVHRWLSGDPEPLRRYAGAARVAYLRYLAERAAQYALERRWPASPFWRRRSRAVGQSPVTRARPTGRLTPVPSPTTGGSDG